MTQDEESSIARCLESVRWADDVVVLDSGSRDRTTEIAKSFPNVRLVCHPFDDFGRQRNRGLHEIAYANPWVLVVDADEVVEPELAKEILALVARRPFEAPAYLLRRRVMMDGRALNWNIAADVWIGRLVRPGAVRYEGVVHERLCFDGTAGRLKGRLAHHQFEKGVHDWFARRARYARLEAAEVCTTTDRGSLLSGLFSRDLLERRRSLKAVFYGMPCRWLVYFLYSLFARLAFLDGTAGLRYIWLETRSLYLASRMEVDV